jgi:hypothetical protein
MSTTPTPPNGMVSNTELILRKILGEDVTPLPPNSRVEFYLVLVKDLIATLQNAVNLKGETTTPLTDNATTNPIMIDGESYTAVMNDAVIYQSGEFIFDGTKWHELGDLSNLTSANIGAMTGYSKASEASAITVLDSLNVAIGKLEKALDLKQSTIDSDHKLSADNVDDTNTTNKFATAAQLSQIQTNKNDILTLQGKVKAHSEGGTNYDVINGIRVYVDSTAPTGTIPTGSLWIGG